MSAKLSMLSQSELVGRLDRDRLAVVRLDPAPGGVEEVGAEHVLQRPAGHQVLRGGGGVGGEAGAEGGHLVAHHLAELVAARRVEVGVVEHVERHLHGRERRPARLDVLEELPVAAGVHLVVVGDVVEEEDVARRGGGLGGGGSHGREVHPQQVAGGRAGHEAARGAGRAAGDALLDGFERVGDQRAVDHAMDRAAEADELRPARRRAREAAEELAGALVVEEDAAVEVADHHALVEFRHQGAELVALLGHVAARLGHQPGHVLLQRAPLLREVVDRRGERARRRVA